MEEQTAPLPFHIKGYTVPDADSTYIRKKFSEPLRNALTQETIANAIIARILDKHIPWHLKVESDAAIRDEKVRLTLEKENAIINRQRKEAARLRELAAKNAIIDQVVAILQQQVYDDVIAEGKRIVSEKTIKRWIKEDKLKAKELARLAKAAGEEADEEAENEDDED